MSKRFKRFIAAALSATLVFSACVFASAENEEYPAFNVKLASALETGLNKAADVLMKAISLSFLDSANVKKTKDYAPYEDFRGDETFIDAPAEGASWSLGYSSASIVPDDLASGGYFKGGYSLDKEVTELLDDLRVRVVCLDDGSGRGAAVFAAVDCIGLANADVRLIRERCADFAKSNGIKSINVSATHTHSGIDTQGIYTNIVKSVFKNIGLSFIRSKNTEPAISPAFLEKIVSATASCVEEAYGNMEKGVLTYAKLDASEYVRDRTAPYCNDGNLYRLLFTPDDAASKPTYIASLGVHPEGVGFEQDVVSADFIYYAEQVVNAHGGNLVFLQGAVGTVTEDMHLSSDGVTETRTDSVIRYGQELGYILLGMTDSAEDRKALCDEERESVSSGEYTPWYESVPTVSESVVEPVLNIKSTEFLAKVDNPVYSLLGKLSLADNEVYKEGLFKYYTPTEVGYMELGGTVKVVLSPGETYGEIIYGGEKNGALPFESLHDALKTEDVMVLDLMNDAAGYVMPDDDFCYFHVDPTEELVEFTGAWGMTSLGKTAASQIYSAFYNLYGEVR